MYLTVAPSDNRGRTFGVFAVQHCLTKALTVCQKSLLDTVLDHLHDLDLSFHGSGLPNFKLRLHHNSIRASLQRMPFMKDDS